MCIRDRFGTSRAFLGKSKCWKWCSLGRRARFSTNSLLLNHKYTFYSYKPPSSLLLPKLAHHHDVPRHRLVRVRVRRAYGHAPARESPRGVTNAVVAVPDFFFLSGRSVLCRIRAVNCTRDWYEQTVGGIRAEQSETWDWECNAYDVPQAS